MSSQQITPELRRWVLEQAAAGFSPKAVLKSMVESGWREDVARRALKDVAEHALGNSLASRPVLEADAADAADMPVAVALPEPALADSPASLWAGDREVQVLMAMHQPRVVVFGGLLSADECDGLMQLAGKRLVRSETVKTDTGDSEVNEARTSDGMFFGRGENPLCDRIEKRIAALLNWPLEYGEGLQVLRYRPGAEYRPHYDYFDPAQPGTAPILRRGGQRVGTLVMYLNTPERGGATTFPDVNLEVAPQKGGAVFFSYDRPHPSTRTLHGGAPVLAGEKWVATKWLREGEFK